MTTFRTISETDFDEFRRLHNEYVNREKPVERVREWYRSNPDLLLGAFDDGTLIGHCLGIPCRDSVVELAGIAVRSSHQRRGIGTALLSRFEARASSLGFDRITLGSAGGYVDEFYRENGYDPVHVLVRHEKSGGCERPEDHGFDIDKTREADGVRKRYVTVDGFDPAELETIRDVFDDPEAIYIMEKDISTDAREDESLQ